MNKQAQRLSINELIERDKKIVERICNDDDFAYYFFHEKCRPLISKILWTMFGNDLDYDELVNELYIHLKKPGTDGLYWHNLRTFDYRTSIFDWIRTVAVRLFYTPSSEVFEIPQEIIDSGLAEKIILDISISQYRKYLWLFYIENMSKEDIISKLNIQSDEYVKLARRSIKSFKSCVKSRYPDYYDLLFSRSEHRETEVNERCLGESSSSIEAEIDIKHYLASMPNQTYKEVLTLYFLEGLSPEEIAQRIGTRVENVYNLKLRGLDQIRDIIILSGEIENIESYIAKVTDDRNSMLLNSIFVKKMSYEDILLKMGLSEQAYKKAKRLAINNLRTIIFKR